MKKSWDPDDFERQAVNAWSRRGRGVERKLKAGESIAFPMLGIPNARLVGPGISITEFPDGSVDITIPDAMGLLNAVVEHLVLPLDRPLSGAEALFLRNQLQLSQAQMARHLGVARETLSRHENGARFPVAESLALRLLVLSSILPGMKAPAQKRAMKLLKEWSGTLAQPSKGKPRRTDLDIPVPSRGRKAFVRLLATGRT